MAEGIYLSHEIERRLLALRDKWNRNSITEHETYFLSIVPAVAGHLGDESKAGTAL